MEAIFLYYIFVHYNPSNTTSSFQEQNNHLPMKKHFLTPLTTWLLLSGGLLVCGCEKEPPPPEVRPEEEPKVELSVTPKSVVPYGGNVDIRMYSLDKVL
jgi:hypothetical protein